MNEAFSDAKNNTAFATSEGVPSLHKGVSSQSSANTSCERAEFISVEITPGSIAFTVIPEGPSSFAKDLVMPINPALVVE